MLDVLVLGAVEAKNHGQTVQLGGPKQRAILARLAMELGRPVSAAALIEDLWDEAPRNPGHALQAHVSRLRTVLPIDIELSPAGYRLDAQDVETDAADFVRLSEHGRALLTSGSHDAAAASLREALELWRGPAFADVPDMHALRADSVWLNKMHERAVADRIDADIAAGQNGHLVPELYSIVEKHPLFERGWGQLMKALYVDGRPHEALEAYANARETFLELLGSEPSPRLSELHQLMLQEVPPEAVIPAQYDAERDASVVEADVGELSPDEPDHGRSVVIGREHERAVLDQLWSEAPHGLRVVSITGEPGIGKTHLAGGYAAGLEARGVAVLRGRCEGALTVAFQPFMEMLRDDVDGLTGQQLTERLGRYPAELIRVLPGLVDRLPEGVRAPLQSDPATEHYRIFDAVACWLSSISQSEPVCLMIDDLQWSGPETRLLMQHLLTSSRRINAIVLLTLRDRERTIEGPEGEQYTALLRQSETLTHLALEGLGESDVGHLLDAEFRRSESRVSTSEFLSQQVATASGGNPLFVLELARHYAGNLTEDHANLDSVAGALPAGLRGVIAERLDLLSPNLRERLECAAVLGRNIDPLALVNIEKCTVAEIDELLTTGSYHGLIEPDPGSPLSYSFSHDVIRIALYDDIAPLRRASLHLLVAQDLETRFGKEDPGQYRPLGYHYAKSTPIGSAAAAVHYLTLAADQSLEQRAPVAAAQLYRTAWDLLAAHGDYEQRCDLLIAMGTAELHAGDPAHRSTLLDAARLAEVNKDSARLTKAAVANNRGWYSSTSDIDAERVDVIEAALATCAIDNWQAKAQLLSAWALENIRDPNQRDAAIARSAEALELVEQLHDDLLLGLMLSNHYAVIYAAFSDPQACVNICRRLHKLADERADPGLQLNASIGLAQASIMVGDFDTADRELDRAESLGEQIQNPARQWMVQGWKAMTVAMRGDLDQAEILIGAALDKGVESDQPDAFTWFSGQFFTLRQLAGRLDEIIDAVEEQVNSLAAGIPAWRAAYALTLTEVGRHDEAEAILDEFLADGLGNLPVDMLWMHGMSYLSAVCVALDKPAAAKEVYETLEPYSGLLANNGTIDAGPIDLHLGNLAAIQDDRDTAERHLDAAIALCNTIDAPIWLKRAAKTKSSLAGAN